MPDSLCVLDSQDRFMVEQVKKSNSIFRLRKELGDELVDIVDTWHQRCEQAALSMFGISWVVGSSVLGWYFYKLDRDIDRKEGRRDFLKNLIGGGALGVFGSTPLAIVSYGSGPLLYGQVNELTKLKRQYPDKARQIDQYLELRFPPFEL